MLVARAGNGAEIVFTGAIVPEAMTAWRQRIEDLPGLGLLNVRSPDLPHRNRAARRVSRVKVPIRFLVPR